MLILSVLAAPNVQGGSPLRVCVQASISIAVIFLSYIGHVNCLPFMRIQAVVATTAAGQSTTVAVVSESEIAMTDSPLALQRLARQKAQDGDGDPSTSGQWLSRRSTAELEPAVDVFQRLNRRRRSTITAMQEKAKLALVSIDYNSFESAYLILSV